MNTLHRQIIALAKAAGYTGGDALTVRGALDALADAVNGADKAVPTDVSGAVASFDGLLNKAPSGTITITENGEDIDVAAYEKATVNVPNPSKGTLTITENGEDIDVTQYAYVTVAVVAAAQGEG